MPLTSLAVFIIVSIVSALAAWAFANMRQQKKTELLRVELQQLQKDAEQFNAEKINKDSQLNELQTVKSDLEQKLSANLARIENTSIKEQEYKEVIKNLKNDLSTLNNTAQRYQQELSDEKIIRAKTASTLEAAKNHLTKYDEQLKIKNSDFKNEQISHQDTLKKLALIQKEKAEYETQLKSEQKSNNTLLEEKEIKINQQDSKIISLEENLDKQRIIQASTQENIGSLKKHNGELNAQLKAEKENFNQLISEKDSQLEKYILESKILKDDLNKERHQHNETKETLSSESNEHGQLKTELEQKQQGFERQLEQINDSRENLKREFEVLANEILEAKSKAFKEQNSENIGHLLNPLKDEIKSFKERVETIHKDDISQRSSLKTELLNLQKLNQDITEQAGKLTNALRNEKKKQGNWGELILENVLDSSGLRLNEDYTLQKSYKDEEGNTQFPDAVVKLPQGKNLIIDAKTSLNSYTQYVNCEDEKQAQCYLASHAKAVSERINELSAKNYFKIPNINSPEVVIMFIPIESAYVEALRFDDTLYQRAIENNILVATPITLLTSLNIVRQLWRFEDQNKHTAELAKRADLFYQKLNGFLVSMQGVGKQLDKAKDSYEKAFGQLYSGRGNLIKQASEFKDLGVAVQKESPAELVSKANLELGVMAENVETKQEDEHWDKENFTKATTELKMTSSNSTTQSRASRKKLRVTFLNNGECIFKDSSAQTFVESLLKFNLEDVTQLGKTINKHELVSKTKFRSDSIHQHGDWYIDTLSNTNQKKSLLEEIGRKLKIPIRVDIV